METKEKDSERIRSGSFRNSLELESYLINKAANHSHYKFYSSKSSVQMICDKHSLILSDGSNWNDRLDRQRMQPSGGLRHFGFCFSFSASENVAMWMLYSQDDGCMIDFDSEAIRGIMNPFEVMVGELIDNKDFVPIDTLNVKDAGIRIALSDMLYVGKTENPEEDDRFCYVRRSGETNKKFEKRLIGDDFIFHKAMPWSYENECRLVVSVPEEKLSHSQRGLRLMIRFDESHIKRLRDKKRIINSPNVGHVSLDDFYRNNSDSKLTNEISWNLRSQFCRSCPKG